MYLKSAINMGQVDHNDKNGFQHISLFPWRNWLINIYGQYFFKYLYYRYRGIIRNSLHFGNDSQPIPNIPDVCQTVAPLPPDTRSMFTIIWNFSSLTFQCIIIIDKFKVMLFLDSMYIVAISLFWIGLFHRCVVSSSYFMF